MHTLNLNQLLYDEESTALKHPHNGAPFGLRHALIAALFDAGHGEHELNKKLQAEGEVSLSDEEIALLKEVTSALYRPAVAKQVVNCLEI